MKRALLARACRKYLAGGLMLFVSAGALRGEGAAQRKVVGLLGRVFSGGFMVAGLDFRFGWSNMPWGVVARYRIIPFIR